MNLSINESFISNETLIDLFIINDSLGANDSLGIDDSLGINDSQDETNYDQFLTQTRFLIQRILVPLIMTIGVVGNSITIVIMTRPRMRSSTNSYLAALAIFDIIYLIFIFFLSLVHYPNIRSIKYYYYWTLWPFAMMICDAASNTSIWLTVTFTIERYIAVCHPIRGKVICTNSRARKIIAIVALITFIITIPTAFEWKIIETKNAFNETYLQETYSELGENELYKKMYYWLTAVMFIILPFILLTIFNIFLIRSVHISSSRRKTMTRISKKANDQHSSLKPKTKYMPSSQESHITIMLIAVVLLFLLCQLPTACVLIYSSFYEHRGNQAVLMRGLGNIFNFLMAINAAGNFVLYCLLSQKYRRTFIKTFCPCLINRWNSFSKAQSTLQSNIGSTIK